MFITLRAQLGLQSFTKWSQYHNRGKHTGLIPQIPAEASPHSRRQTSTRLRFGVLRVSSAQLSGLLSKAHSGEEPAYQELSFLHPPVPLKWHNGMPGFPIEDFPFTNKQAKISLICFLFNKGRRQLTVGQGEQERKWVSQAPGKQASGCGLEGVQVSGDRTVTGRLSIGGLWHFRKCSVDARVPVFFLRFRFCFLCGAGD